MFSLKAAALGVGIAFLAGGIVGANVTSKYYKVGIYASKVKNLEKQINARDSAVALDTDQAIADRKEIERLKEANRDLQNRITAGQCFSVDDTNGLRDFFERKQAPASPRRSKSLFRG